MFQDQDENLFLSQNGDKSADFRHFNSTTEPYTDLLANLIYDQQQDSPQMINQDVEGENYELLGSNIAQPSNPRCNNQSNPIIQQNITDSGLQDIFQGLNPHKDPNDEDQNNYPSVFKTVLIKKRGKKSKSTNVGKKFVDLLIKYLPKFKNRRNNREKQAIDKEIQKLREQKRNRKVKQYKFYDLVNFFSRLEEKIQGSGPINRMTFSFLLGAYFTQSMKSNRSKINDRQMYLRNCKVYMLRCRSKLLSQRNQSK